MDWKRILRIAAVLCILMLLASVFMGCKKGVGIVDWDDCSQAMGDHPCDFTLVDQYGNDFNLYEHHGKIIILDFSAMWCGPCQLAAFEVEDLQQEYGEDVVYVTILVENTHQNPTRLSDAKAWADAFNIVTAPVLQGSRELISADPDIGWPLAAWPQFHIINKDMVLVDSFKGYRNGKIEGKIIEHLEAGSEAS